MSASLSAERDRLQQQVEELEQSLSVTHAELDLLSSESGEESEGNDSEEEGEQSAAGLLAQRNKIQEEIQNLENFLGGQSPILVSDDDDGSSSEESEVGLPPTADSCLQLNLVYQQVLQETLDQLETLLAQNQRQQRDVVTQLAGSTKEAPKEQSSSSSCDHHRMFLGSFFKPYFKDKLTGLGPPANQETKEKASRLTGCLEGKNLKLKRWESWQKTLLIHSVARDSLRRLIQPKLSKMDYLSQKMSSAVEADRQPLRQQIDNVEREIDMLRKKKEDELIGERFDEHDWQKISNVDFEGTRDAEDIERFWQNFLHPSINKSRWTQEEVQLLKEVSETHGERDWETIASDLESGRTAFLCLQTFQRFVSGSLRHSSWTPAEDFLLKELVEKMRIGNFIPYTQMSYFIEGRDTAQLIYRWTQVLDPSLRKGPWTKEEDEMLLKAVSYYGEKEWWKIRLEVPGRTDGACRDRYLDCLKTDIKRGPFEILEQRLLLQLVEKHGVGHWAKIAAEIPHRFDAQCMREWRRLSSSFRSKRSRGKKSPGGKEGTKKRIRKKRKVVKKVKSEDEEEEEEEDEDKVVYMESDGEAKTVEEVRSEEVVKEEEYIVPPMGEWIPAERVSPGFMVFQPVEFPPTGDTNNVKARSTIIGLFGRSVIIGPRPKGQSSNNRHSNRTMMMVSADQLRIYLAHQAEKFNHLKLGPPRKTEVDKKNNINRVTELGLGYQLQAAVIPWIGNALIPSDTRVRMADVLREQGEKRQLTSTSVFLLFLQTMNVDTVGCKEVIEQRRICVMQSVPAPENSALKPKLKSKVGSFQQRKIIKELRELDLQHKLILEQLYALQQQKQQQPMQQQVVVLQQATSPNTPGILFKMPPNMHPQMSFPQGVYISQSVPTQPTVFSCTSPPALQRMNNTPLTVVTIPSNASLGQQARPLPPSLNAKASSSPSSSKRTPAKGRRSKKEKVEEAVVSSPNVMDIKKEGGGLGGASTGVDTEDDSKTTISGRLRKPSQKAKALQGATLEKAELKKKAAPSRRRKPKTKDTSSPPEGVGTVPVQLVLQTSPSSLTDPNTAQRTESLKVFPVPVDQACSNGSVSSTQNVHVASLLPIPTNQHTASSAALPPSDHTYISLHPPPNSGKQSVKSKSPSRSKKSGPAPKKTPKAAPSKKRKGASKDDEQNVTSSQDEQSASRTGDAEGVKSDAATGEVRAVKVEGETGTGVQQEGKRVRKPSQKAKAFQESNQAEDESTKKRTPSSTPPKKRPRQSRRKQDKVVPKQQVAPVPGLCLSPSQPVWVMTPGGPVQLAETPPQGLRLAIAPGTPSPASRRRTTKSKQAAPPLRSLAPRPPSMSNPVTLLPLPPSPARPLPPTFILQPVSNPAFSQPSPCPTQPPSIPVSPAEKAAPPSLRKETLQFDPSLMFLESRVEVQVWLSGQGGVVVPGAGATLPYLPPFVSNLSTLSELLRAKKSLTKLSLQLLSQASESQPEPPKTSSKPDGITKETSGQPSELPDSTSDLEPTADKPAAPPLSSEPKEKEEKEENEEEHVAALRHLVAERFADNSAYQLLKARFLSCFTVPALLASLQPITVKKVATLSEEEEEEEEMEGEEKKTEEEEEKIGKIKESGRGRRHKTSLLECGGAGAPANHFSGMDTRASKQTGQEQAETVQ
ncbi:snRNA-activating protein complex subunit 4 [Notolabrus celidotus]|uniref:snRNA-activating protein complex subunit 4 n=1 Tax=Notolabrus celidotus TaxID=1203425 RepID=UPI00148FD99B|nr:snRNA-activating protein complex subunit 4 [Notolabrus celidotus]